MKIQELCRLMGASDREALEKAFAECYKELHKVWRFMVRDFIKRLDKVPQESGNYPKAVKLLTDLYGLICEACSYYLFSTEDAFRSIGWKQSEFFELVAKKTFAAGYSRENIANLLLHATTGGLSREALYIQQEMVLLGSLRTSDVKYMAIEEAKKLVEDRKKKLAGPGKYDNQRYDLESAVNELCGMILLISIDLAEPESGVDFYFKNSRERDKEITLYCVLMLIGIMAEDDLWIKVYEYGVGKKIKPRDSLAAEYEERKRKEKQRTN